MTTCGAKTRSGHSCKNAPVTGSRRCRMHGGKTPRGMALPQTTHGRYSKDLPTRLAARYAESQADPDLLNLNEEIALLDSRLGELLRRVDSGESGQTWRDLKATFVAMEQAQRAKEFGEVARLLGELGALIRHGHSDYAAWADVRTLIDQRRKLVESEGKRRKDMQDMITSEKAMVLVSALTDSVRRHVNDRTVLAAISTDIRALLDHSGG